MEIELTRFLRTQVPAVAAVFDDGRAELPTILRGLGDLILLLADDTAFQVRHIETSIEPLPDAPPTAQEQIAPVPADPPPASEPLTTEPSTSAPTSIPDVLSAPAEGFAEAASSPADEAKLVELAQPHEQVVPPRIPEVPAALTQTDADDASSSAAKSQPQPQQPPSELRPTAPPITEQEDFVLDCPPSATTEAVVENLKIWFTVASSSGRGEAYLQGRGRQVLTLQGRSLDRFCKVITLLQFELPVTAMRYVGGSKYESCTVNADLALAQIIERCEAIVALAAQGPTDHGNLDLGLDECHETAPAEESH